MRNRNCFLGIIFIVVANVAVGSQNLTKDHEPQIGANGRLKMNRLTGEFQAKRAGTQGTDDEEDVLQVNKRMLKAIQEKDAEILDRILADDAVITSPYGDIRTKSQFIRDITTSNGSEGNPVIDDVKVRMFGCVAIVNSRVTSEGDSFDVGLTNSARETAVFVKQGEQWKLVSDQETTVANRKRKGS